jgi:hypothetical protein
MKKDFMTVTLVVAYLVGDTTTNITALRITITNTRLSITTQNVKYCYYECCYAECCGILAM